MKNSESSQTIQIIQPEILLGAYASGIFPMSPSDSEEIHWFSPDPRAIIPLDTFKISRSLRQVIKKNIFTYRFDTAFEQVMRECAKREETWISETIIRSYVNLHDLGFAHSVEAWHENKLVGGLYGVALGAAFFGESMFSRKKDASKVALAALVERLNERDFELLDTQYITPHLAQFGTFELPREEYLQRLKKAVGKKRRFIE
ncbi:MAG: leucyl/phenylalanyl-tRNA--protein transferase [Bacteroidota bacterium]